MPVIIRSKIITLSLCFFSFFLVKAQIPPAAFSFSCVKDTVLSCYRQCITLTARIPNIRASTNAYVVNRIS